MVARTIRHSNYGVVKHSATISGFLLEQTQFVSSSALDSKRVWTIEYEYGRLADVALFRVEDVSPLRRSNFDDA